MYLKVFCFQVQKELSLEVIYGPFLAFSSTWFWWMSEIVPRIKKDYLSLLTHQVVRNIDPGKTFVPRGNMLQGLCSRWCLLILFGSFNSAFFGSIIF